MSRRPHRAQGFSAAELLVAMAIAAIAIGAAAVSFGTLVRAQPKVANTAVVTLDATRLLAYYNLNSTTVQAPVAPNYGTQARAENLRERFLADTVSAIGVYCLARSTANTYHPFSIPYNPNTDRVLDGPVNFRQLLLDKAATTGVTAASFLTQRNRTPDVPNSATYTYGASVFVIGYSPYATSLVVTAIYDIDVDKVASPKGFYASVKRWAGSNLTAPGLTDYYDIFYPTSTPNTWPTTPDEFAPLWVSFERQSRKALTETAAIDRYKIARDMPFYFIWWPDPALSTLDATRAKLSPPATTSPRYEYYQMGGRTAFMFTVPAFPSS